MFIDKRSALKNARKNRRLMFFRNRKNILPIVKCLKRVFFLVRIKPQDSHVSDSVLPAFHNNTELIALEARDFDSETKVTVNFLFVARGRQVEKEKQLFLAHSLAVVRERDFIYVLGSGFLVSLMVKPIDIYDNESSFPLRDSFHPVRDQLTDKLCRRNVAADFVDCGLNVLELDRARTVSIFGWHKLDCLSKPSRQYGLIKYLSDHISANIFDPDPVLFEIAQVIMGRHAMDFTHIFCFTLF